MFIAALIVAVLTGYILNGSLKNIDTSKIKAFYFVFAAFFIEAVVIFSMRKGFIARGTVTFMLDLMMYVFLLIFVYKNKSNKWIVLIGAGFLLNALPIFFNGGAMPVSTEALKAMGFTGDVNSHGLYALIDRSTRLSFLGDIIYIKYPAPNAISLGDIVEAIGVMLFVITSMVKKKESVKLK